MGKREEILNWLEGKGIAYELMEHPPVYTIEDMEQLGICLKGNVCKNLFLRDGKGKRHFLVMLARDKQADLKQVQFCIGGTACKIFEFDKRRSDTSGNLLRSISSRRGTDGRGFSR